MSGGKFDYNQYKIRQMWEDIQQELDKQGKEKSKEDLRYYGEEYFEKYPEERFEPVHPEEVQKIFRDGVEALKKAEIYAQRIDWYLSGDDGVDSLVSRLKSELDELYPTVRKDNVIASNSSIKIPKTCLNFEGLDNISIVSENPIPLSDLFELHLKLEDYLKTRPEAIVNNDGLIVGFKN